MQQSGFYPELRVEADQEVCKEVRPEAWQEGERSLLPLLTRWVEALPDTVRSHVEALSLTQLKSLGEALLDCSSVLSRIF